MIVMRIGSGSGGGGILRRLLFSSRSLVLCTERISRSPCAGQKLISSRYRVLQVGHSFMASSARRTDYTRGRGPVTSKQQAVDRKQSRRDAMFIVIGIEKTQAP